MDSLEHALDIANQMRDLLAAELEEARQQRVLVRELDVQGLFERARRRGEFNVQLAGMQDGLADALVAGAAELGLPRLCVETLRPLGFDLATRLAEALSELRACAQALQEIDNLNRLLARRALGCVRGYLSAMSPKASVYDRFGSLRNEGPTSIARQVA